MHHNKKAFTLIELLVVVFIIGILAAVALPQYQKAMRRAKASEILTLIKAVAAAQDIYYLTNGAYSINFDDLDLKIHGIKLAAPPAGDDYLIVQDKDFEIALKNAGADVYGIYSAGKRPLLRMNVKTKRIFCCETAGELCPALGAVVSSGTTSEERSCYLMP
jgi:prepilin-type N-terminal cleavage/methylation domain-containing protein